MSLTQHKAAKVLLMEIIKTLYGRICSVDVIGKTKQEKENNCFYWSPFCKIVLIYFRRKKNRLIDPAAVIFGSLSLSCWLSSLLHSRLSWLVNSAAGGCSHAVIRRSLVRSPPLAPHPAVNVSVQRQAVAGLMNPSGALALAWQTINRLSAQPALCLGWAGLNWLRVKVFTNCISIYILYLSCIQSVKLKVNIWTETRARTKRK